MTMEVLPATVDRLADLDDLFDSHGGIRGCWCQAFSVTRSEYQDGFWNGGNRLRFHQCAQEAHPPLGLVAYQDGRPVGWCALGPRSRYPAAIGPRARILANRNHDEDEDVWLVSCFFVRVGFRGTGITYALLKTAIELARAYGAPAIEGWPRSGASRQQSDLYFGREKLFADSGFTAVDRPSPNRVVMRLELDGHRVAIAPDQYARDRSRA
jgi:GNAT superfamily N-acetyltransferase